VALDGKTLLYAFGWMAIGLVVYFAYGIKNSKLQRGEDTVLDAGDSLDKE
jgi:hypothetical protein